MATGLTDFGSLTTLQKRVWSANVWRQALDQAFWFVNGFVSKGLGDSSKPIHLVDELTKTDKGSKCVMPMVLELVNDGIVGDNELEGNEEPLSADDCEIQLDQLRNGVKSRGRMSEQDTVIRFRGEAKQKLGYWIGDKLDEIMFLSASGMAYTLKLDNATRSTSSQLSSLRFSSDVTAPSTNRKMYAGSATSTATLTAADTMDWNLIVRAKAAAERKHIKPLRMGGKPYYCVVMSTENSRDLKLDEVYQKNLRGAAERGDGNPLFTGAFAVVDGVMLYAHNKVATTQGLSSGSKWGASGTVEGAQAMLLGAQAMAFARIGEAQWGESDNQDYGNREGISVGRMIGIKKPVFKSQYESGTPSEDFGLIQMYTAAVAAG